MSSNETLKEKPRPTPADMAWLEVEVVELKLRELIIVAQDAVGDLRRARGIWDRFVKDSPRRQAAVDAGELQRQADFLNSVSPTAEQDRREEGRRRVRVFSAIGAYLAKKKRK